MMRVTSLRSKVFLLVGTIVCLFAAATILVTQRDVRRAVIDGEEIAVRNVLTLLARDSEARWGSLLVDKVATVRQSRRHLIELGTAAHAVLATYQQQVDQGLLTTAQAQRQAIRWINSMGIENPRFGFVFDRELNVIASGEPGMLGANLAAMRDFKGRLLASSAYQEAVGTGQSFALYRWPLQDDPGERELRYAYFGYFEPWDWVFAISDSVRDVSEQFERRRLEMESAIGETLASLHLAQSGFAFIVDEKGRVLPELRPTQADLLAAHERAGGPDLLERLQGMPPVERITTWLFEPLGTARSWQISAIHNKPLKWTIVAAVPASDLGLAANRLSTRLLWVFAGVLGISLLLAWALAARMARPLRQLSDYARALPEQDLSLPARTPPHIQGLPARQPDEVGRLAATFIYMDEQLREKIARLVDETSSRERLESELDIAHSIQMGLLPPAPDAALLAHAELHGSMTPAKAVGGDLYDHLLLPDGRICLAIGDVSDKGVPAALFMAFTATLIRAWVDDTPDPARLMARINDRLAENNPRMMFTTLLLAVFDPATGRLCWSNAGHPPPLRIDPHGGVGRLEGRSGPACGVMTGVHYHGFETVLQPGECLFGYTDGLSEALAASGEWYGEARLVAVLRAQGAKPVAALGAAVLADVHAFADGAEQADDMTVLVLRRTAARPPAADS